MSFTSKRALRAFCALLMVVVGVLGTTATASAAKTPKPPKKDAADGIDHYERDVFVIIGSTLRHPDDTTSPDAPLFNDAGVNLGLTWGQWTAADATSTMEVHGQHTDADIHLTGLVPGGVYSVFYVTLLPDSENPGCPGVERGLPLTSTEKHQVPDSSSFVATSDGTTHYKGRIDGDPLSSYQVIVEIVYHSDGQTYGSFPNVGEFLTQGRDDCRSSYGEDAMRQLLILQKQ